MNQAQTIANDIVAQIGWGDLSLAKTILYSLQNKTLLTMPQQTSAQQFINNLPLADQQPLNQLLQKINGGRK